MKDGICKLDFSSCGTLASQLADNISRAIASGDLRPGDKLPSISKMAELCGTSVRVPREAVRLLENEGVVKGRPRAGLFVLGKTRFVWRGSVLFVSYGRQSYYYRGVLFKNIASRLSEEGWRVDFVNVLDGEGSRGKQLDSLRRALRNGHSLVFGAHLDSFVLSEIRKAGMPYFAVVGLTGDGCDDAVGLVSLSESDAIMTLSSKCAASGVRYVVRFAFGDAEQVFETLFWKKGIVTENIVMRPDTSVARFENTASSVYKRLYGRLRDLRRPKVDLVYFADDSFTQSGLWAIHDAGFCIPSQIKVATHSNAGNRPFYRLPLAFVEHDLMSYVNDISHHVLAFLNGRKHARRIVCSARFVPGETL